MSDADVSKTARPVRPVEFRGGGFAPSPVRGIGLAVFVVLMVAAEIGTRSGFISNLTLPRPSAVLETFGQLWQTGLLWQHLLPSLQRLIIGASLGISLGVMIGLFSYVRAGLVPLVAALFPIPKIALLPLFVIWFGIDEMSKYMLIAFGTFTPTVVATYGAVDNVDRSLIRMGQSFGLSWWSIVRKSCCRALFRRYCQACAFPFPSPSSCWWRQKCSARNMASARIFWKPVRSTTLKSSSRAWRSCPSWGLSSMS